MPRVTTIGQGAYTWPRFVRIAASSGEAGVVATQVTRWAGGLGIRSSVVPGESAHEAALIVNRTAEPQLGAEGYRLVVSRSGLVIRANSSAGLFYGLQTLMQLTSRAPDGAIESRCVEITDWPRFRWRAVHLDVSRHFFSVQTVERLLDVAAYYKLNVLHWHLTDDEAWRLEIPRWPLLTQRASCDTAEANCGFYTAAMIRDVLAYAHARHIVVEPEIDIPGHSLAALRAYPALGCQGIARPHVLCPTATTFAFLNDVFSEVSALFPGRYVHLGGDEVELGDWRTSPVVRDLIRSGRASSVRDVEGYILREAAAMVRRHGRRAVVWDDALASAIPADVVVVAWRGTRAVRLALETGHEAVVNPDGPLYFDGYQGDPDREPPAMRYRATLEQVYQLDPLAGIDERAAHRVIGLQADLWTEQIATPDHLFYMLLPRAIALAEVAWSDARARSWTGFRARLAPQLAWLEEGGYPFRVPDVRFTVLGGPATFQPHDDRVQQAVLTTSRWTIRLAIDVPARMQIRYTTDGTEPSERAALYRGPITVAVSPAGNVVRASAFFADGRRGSVDDLLLRHSAIVSPPDGRRTFASWDDVIGSRQPGTYVPPRFP